MMKPNIINSRALIILNTNHEEEQCSDSGKLGNLF